MGKSTQATAVADFLLARFAEEEALANELIEHAEPIHYGGDFDLVWPGHYEGRIYGAKRGDWDAHIPARRLLAECQAKRAIVEAASHYRKAYPDWSPVCETAASEGLDCNVSDAFFAHMAAVYADHPDYRQEWGS